MIILFGMNGRLLEHAKHIPRKTQEEQGRFLDEAVDRTYAKDMGIVYRPIALEFAISTGFTIYGLACAFCWWAAVPIL